jgi:hypothetical protein
MLCCVSLQVCHTIKTTMRGHFPDTDVNVAQQYLAGRSLKTVLFLTSPFGTSGASIQVSFCTNRSYRTSTQQPFSLHCLADVPGSLKEVGIHTVAVTVRHVRGERIFRLIMPLKPTLPGIDQIHPEKLSLFSIPLLRRSLSTSFGRCTAR